MAKWTDDLLVVIDGFLILKGIGYVAELPEVEFDLNGGRWSRFRRGLDGFPVRLRCAFDYEEMNEQMHRYLDAVEERTSGLWSLRMAGKRAQYLDPIFVFELESDAVSFKLSCFESVSPEL